MIVNINDTNFNLFLNSNTSFFNNLNDKSVAVVGNSGILLDNEYGSKIDKHDITIRFNAARVKGYEKNVGSKTDIRLMNGHIFNGSSNPKRFKKNDPNFTSNLNNETLIVKSWNQQEFVEGILKTTPQNKVYFLNPPFTQYCNSLTGQEATCGVVGVLFLSLFTSKISCFGFNFYKDGWSKNHYWEEMEEYKQGHSFNVEEQLFDQLEQEGKIKIFK
jgi:hypothetical protein